MKRKVVIIQLRELFERAQMCQHGLLCRRPAATYLQIERNQNSPQLITKIFYALFPATRTVAYGTVAYVYLHAAFTLI